MALLILTIGLVGVLALFPVGFEAVARSINTTVATFLAQELLEDAKLAGYDGVDGMETSSGTWGAPYDNYEYTLQVTTDIDGLDLKQVDVEIFWPAGATTQKHVSLTTYIAKYEP